MRWRRRMHFEEPGYRTERLKPKLALTEFLSGSDQLADIEEEARAQSPKPISPEELLIQWAKQYYWSGGKNGERFLHIIGLWVAEDLKLRGKLS